MSRQKEKECRFCRNQVLPRHACREFVRVTCFKCIVSVDLLALLASAAALVVVLHRTGNRRGLFAKKPLKQGFDKGHEHGGLLGSFSISKFDAMADAPAMPESIRSWPAKGSGVAKNGVCVRHFCRLSLGARVAMPGMEPAVRAAPGGRGLAAPRRGRADAGRRARTRAGRPPGCGVTNRQAGEAARGREGQRKRGCRRSPRRRRRARAGKEASPQRPVRPSRRPWERSGVSPARTRPGRGRSR